MKFFTFFMVMAFVIAPSIGAAGKGPKGGPSFESYEWSEIVETDFLEPERWEPRAGLQAVELHNHLFVICLLYTSDAADECVNV